MMIKAIILIFAVALLALDSVKSALSLEVDRFRMVPKLRKSRRTMESLGPVSPSSESTEAPVQAPVHSFGPVAPSEPVETPSQAPIGQPIYIAPAGNPVAPPVNYNTPTSFTRTEYPTYYPSASTTVEASSEAPVPQSKSPMQAPIGQPIYIAPAGNPVAPPVNYNTPTSFTRTEYPTYYPSAATSSSTTTEDPTYYPSAASSSSTTVEAPVQTVVLTPVQISSQSTNGEPVYTPLSEIYVDQAIDYDSLTTSTRTEGPTLYPTTGSSSSPSNSPTNSPTKSPTYSPTNNPTSSPTYSPTSNPTNSPTSSPTNNPTKSPTYSPTSNPTNSPTSSPTNNPTKSPTSSPTDTPTASPIAVTQELCQDSGSKAFVGNAFLTCTEIVESGLCSDNAVWGHCRKSCNKCDRCRNSKVKFEITLPDKRKKKKRKCYYVSTNKELCDDVDVFNACGKTCGACS